MKYRHLLAVLNERSRASKRKLRTLSPGVSVERSSRNIAGRQTVFNKALGRYCRLFQPVYIEKNEIKLSTKPKKQPEMCFRFETERVFIKRKIQSIMAFVK